MQQKVKSTCSEVGMLFDNMNEDRRKMLDEIRLRAEEAELARIEAQEIQLGDHLSEIVSIVPLPPPPVKGLSRGEGGPQDVLLDGEITPLDPGEQDNVIDPVKINLGAKDNDRLEELLHSANALYQQEKYQNALDVLNNALGIDPQNQDALALKANVEKGRDLLARLKDDQSRRKLQSAEAGKQNATPPPAKAKVIAPPATNDNIDQQPVPSLQGGPEPKQTSELKQTRLKKSHVRSSLKWLSFAALAILGITSALVVYENVRDKFLLPKKTVLVLPAHFSNVPQYVADGLTEELITRLSHNPALRVFGASTAFDVRNAEGSSAAASLGAEYFLQWNLEPTSDGFAIQFNLVQSATSAPVFNRVVNVSREDMAGLFLEVIPALATAMDSEDKQSEATFTTSPGHWDAFDPYLQGRYLLRHPELASLDSVVYLFEMSRKAEPSFPMAEAALGWTHILRYDASRESTQTDLVEASKNLQRAVNLGAKNSEIYKLWGAIEYYRSNFKNAADRYEQAIHAAPSDGEAYRSLSFAYLRVGNNKDAMEAASRGALLDPSNHVLRRHLGMILLAQRKNQEALEEFEADLRKSKSSDHMYDAAYLSSLVATNHQERGIDILKERAQLNPRDFEALYDLGRVLQLAGKSQAEWGEVLQQALLVIDDTLKVSPRLALAYSYRGLIQTRLGQFSGASQSNARAMELAPADIAVLYNSARTYALQRNKEAEAIAYLTKAVDRKFVLENLLDLDFTNLQNMPQFKAFLGG